MKITNKIFKEITANPALVGELNENDIASIIQEANDQYYNKNKSVISDEIYDYICDTLKKKDPNHPILQAVGAKVDGSKIKLPYWMGSQNKIKADVKVLNNWLKTYKGGFILSDKLDGISALLHIKNGTYNLYTRGNGEQGSNISNTVRFINNIPTNITDDISIRGELIISKANFAKVKNQGANARNMVSGIFNSKKPNLDLIKLVDFVSYQVLYPTKILPSLQLEMLIKKKFDTVYFALLPSISVEILSDYMIQRKNNSIYEIDGIVVQHDHAYDNIKSGNPKHSFAFKNILTHEKAEVIVLDIEWNISKDGYIIPIVIFPSVNLGGVNIQKAAGHNAKFIKDNNIGPGSKIVIIRSGDVIPYVTDVLKPSNTGRPKFPEDIDYTWNKTGVDIIANDLELDDINKKIITNFFVKLKAKGISTGIVNKLYDNGFDTIYKVLHITVDDLLDIEGIQGKSAQNIYNSIHEINLTDCLSLMNASNAFGRGFGERKLKLFLDEFPNIMDETPPLAKIIEIKGINEISAVQFLECLVKFKEFLKINKLKCKVSSNQIEIPKNDKQNLLNIAVMFTGFRDASMEKEVLSRGGSIKTTLTNKVDILIIKDSSIDNKKTESAAELNVKIMTRDEFINKYFN